MRVLASYRKRGLAGRRVVGWSGQKDSDEVPFPPTMRRSMIEVTIDTITAHRGSLWLGLQVWGPKRSWVRFARVEVPLRTLDLQTFQVVLDEWDKVGPDSQPAEPLF
jgi:hypothetical protein